MILYTLAVVFSLIPLAKKERVEMGEKREADIAIFSYKEEEELVIKTAESWAHVGNVYVVRDGPVEKLRELEEKGIRIVKREKAKGRKAGAINYFMERYGREHVLIVDADERLEDRECLWKVLKAKGDVVVAKKSFEGKGVIGKAMQYTNEMFRIPQREMGREGKAFFNGSLGVISKRVWEAVKFRNLTIEDIDFSVRAIQKGFRFVYVDCVLARGEQPTFGKFILQQLRYSYGNGEVLRMNKVRDPLLLFWLLFLPLFSLFQTGVLLLSLFEPVVLAYEFVITYPLFVLAIGKANPIHYAATFLLNLVVLPPLRVAYTIFGLLGIEKEFGTTLG